MDEPFSNYPAGNRRTTLNIPQQFVKLTAAAYFFMPSISALRTVLTRSAPPCEPSTHSPNPAKLPPYGPDT
jgi:hypothetical protein